TGSVQGALKHYVGAANLRHDGGYGAKVISMRERIWIASQGRKVPSKVELAGAIRRANEAHAAAVASVRTAGRSGGALVAVN
ncbi:MAG: lytic transglycosylase domain-containing protein, partial [Burkholderiaceae bacterium]